MAAPPSAYMGLPSLQQSGSLEPPSSSLAPPSPPRPPFDASHDPSFVPAAPTAALWSGPWGAQQTTSPSHLWRPAHPHSHAPASAHAPPAASPPPPAAHLDPWAHGGAVWRPATSQLNPSMWTHAGEDCIPGISVANGAGVAPGGTRDKRFPSFHRDLVDSFAAAPEASERATPSADMASFGESFHSLNIHGHSPVGDVGGRGFGTGGGLIGDTSTPFPQREEFPHQPQHHHRSFSSYYGAVPVEENASSLVNSAQPFPSSSASYSYTRLSADRATSPSASSRQIHASQRGRTLRSSQFSSGQASLPTNGAVSSGAKTPESLPTIAGSNVGGSRNGNGNGNGHGSGRSRSAHRRRRRPNGDNGPPGGSGASHVPNQHQSQQQPQQQHNQQQNPQQHQRARNHNPHFSQSHSGGSNGGRRSGAYGNPGPLANGNGGGSGQTPSVREYNRRISACARRRDLNGALHALAEVDASPNVQRNLFTYNAVINALVMCSQYARADELWDEMIGSGIQPNLVTYNTRLKSCFTGADADVDRAFALVREMEANSIAPDRVTYNSLINSCVAAGRVDDARDVYEEMQRKHIVADDFTFTTLAKAGASQNNIEMLDALLVHQLKHHTAIRHRTLQASQSVSSSNGTSGHQKRHNNMYGTHANKPNFNTNNGGNSVPQDLREICPVAYNAIADAYIRCGHPQRALDLLNRMQDPKYIASNSGPPSPEYIPVAPDVQSFNVKLKALRESGASTKEAFGALEEMQALGLETDHISLLTLADLCCRRGEMGLAEGVLRVATSADVREAESGSAEWSCLAGSSMSSTTLSGGANGGNRRNNNQPRTAKANASLFNALIRGYSSLDPPNVEAALALYAEMRRFVDVHGFHFYAPDSVTYTMLVDSFARIGDAERAEQIICEMEAAGPAPTSVVAFNAFLKANRSAGSGKAFEIFERIKSRGLTPDLVTINQLVDILSSEPNGLQHAERLVGEMPKWGLSPDLHTYNCLIKGAARSKGFNQNPGSALDSAFHWLRELRKNKLRADEFTYQSMTAACAAAGDAPRALQFFRCVEEERARRLRGLGGSSSGGSGSFSSTTGTTGSGVTNRSASTGNFSDVCRSSSAGDVDAGPTMLNGQGSDAEMSVRSKSPSRVDAPPGLSRAGQSLGANLMMLGSHAGLIESSMSASNASNSRNGSGGTPGGSSSSQGSNDDFLLLAHPAAYVALMRAFLSSGREDGIDATLRLRDEMVDRGLELGRSGYTAVADAYAERGDSGKVEETLREMVSRGSGSDGGAGLSAVHHSIRMKSLCKQGRIDDAIALLPEVENPDAGVFNTLLFTVGRNKDKHRMVTILRAMENAGIQPDAITGRAMQPLMRSLARALRTFDDRFQDRITTFVSNPQEGSSTGGTGDSSSGSGASETGPPSNSRDEDEDI